MASESDYERDYERKSRRMRGMAERLEVLEKKLERRRKREDSSSESESSGDTEDDKRRRRSKKVKRAKRVKRRSRKVDRWEERRTAARKVSDRSDKPKAECLDNTVMSDYLDVASDVENLCVEEGGVDIFLEDKDNVMHGRLRKCTGFWREIGRPSGFWIFWRTVIASHS